MAWTVEIVEQGPQDDEKTLIQDMLNQGWTLFWVIVGGIQIGIPRNRYYFKRKTNS